MFRSLPGIPGWSAVLIATAICLVGIILDVNDGELGSAFSTFFMAGCILAVIAVQRRAVFMAGIQPPLLMLFIVPPLVLFSALLSGNQSDVIQLAESLLPLLALFPTMAATTLITLSLAIVRAFISEPRVHNN